MAKAPCSRATSLPSCRIGVTSALCEVIQISFRSEPRRSAASSKGSNYSHSSGFMAAGGRRTFSRTQKQPLRDPPNGICAGSGPDVVINCRPSAPLADDWFGNCRGSRAGCLNQNAGGTPATTDDWFGNRCGCPTNEGALLTPPRQFAARRSQPAHAPIELRIVTEAFPQDSLQ
jgi:hypothetical protein